MGYLPGATRCAPPGRAQPGGVQVPGGEASSRHQVTPQSPALTSSHHEALYLTLISSITLLAGDWAVLAAGITAALRWCRGRGTAPCCSWTAATRPARSCSSSPAAGTTPTPGPHSLVIAGNLREILTLLLLKSAY